MMKRLFLFLFFIFYLLLSFSQHDIFTVGFFSDPSVSYLYSKVWKNSVELFTITEGNINCQGHDVFVTEDENVYVSGIYNENPYYVGDAIIWQNGIPIFTSLGGYGSKVIVDGSDLYMCGVKRAFYSDIASVWKNGNILYSMSFSEYGFSAGAYDMCLANGDIYVAGDQTKVPSIGYSYYAATVWKNGEVLYDLATTASAAMSVFVDGDDVYVGGYEVLYGYYQVGRIWKNGEVLYSYAYPDYPDPYHSYAEVLSVFVANQDVYAVGKMGPGGNFYVGKLWKNGEELYTFENYGNSFVDCVDVIVINNEVYSCCSFFGGSVLGSSKIYKNGDILYDLQHCSATSMFIIPDSTISVKKSETNHINVYPNPTSDKITISMSENSHTALFVLYDIAGRELLRKTIKHEECIDVSRFVSGVYIYTVES
ncbi:MAG: T9SS type A sorting domain-containing protein, partial [Bacteroidales bacterium]|nr:T9SS type A sorting domain-containing protein [Bacteroidales bacterium]